MTHWNQYYEAKFIDTNPIPRDITDLEELAEWFHPLVEAEKAAGVR